MTAQEKRILAIKVKNGIGVNGYYLKPNILVGDALDIVYLVGINDVELYLTQEGSILFLNRGASVNTLNNMHAIKRIDLEAKNDKFVQFIVPEFPANGEGR